MPVRAKTRLGPNMWVLSACAWSIANTDFFTGKRVAAHNGPADVHAVFARAVVTSFGVFLLNGNTSDFLLFVHD